jgi:SRSO17 transposase
VIAQRSYRRGLEFDLVARISMTEDDVHAAAERLEEIFERFAPFFGKAEAQSHAFHYVKGLMVCPGRKSIEPIARSVGEGRISGLQKFINSAPWQADEIQAEIQAVFDERLAVAGTGATVGAVGVIQECGFVKKGKASVGVERQFNLRTGKSNNCQVGLFLVGVVPGAAEMLDHQLFLPVSWCAETEEDRARRVRVHVPEEATFRTKAQVAADLARGLVVLGQVHLDWIVSQEPYASDLGLLDELERLEQRYLLEVPSTTLVADPDSPASGPSAWSASLNHAPAMSWPVAELCKRGPVAWFRSPTSDDACEWGVVRVRVDRLHGPASLCWLLAQRPSPKARSLRFYLSNAGPETPADLLPRVLETREQAARYFNETLALLGHGHYETRSWIGWHHHNSLVALAHLAVTLARETIRPTGDASAPVS